MQLDDKLEEDLLKSILDIEWNMFSSVNSESETNCRTKEKTFRLMREMSYSVFDNSFLKSILDNLEEAVIAGRNLMTEKYARMQNKIPVLNNSPHILKIVEAETVWMHDLTIRYPYVFKDRKDDFEKYIQSELETYSDTSLGLYSKLIDSAKESGINIVEERYNFLFKQMGYQSLADKESEERHKDFWKNNTCRGC